MVDEDADELVTDGLVHERRGHGRVDTAGEAADHAARADLGADPVDLLGDDVAAVPVGGNACRVVQEVLEHSLAEVGVLDLGVPLHAVELTGVARESSDGRHCGASEDLEPVRGLRHLIAVAHPDVLQRGLAVKEDTFGEDRGVRRAVLAQAGVGDLAAELLRHHLEAVANAERRHAEFEHAGVELRCIRLVDRRRPAREDDPHGFFRRDLRGGHRVRHDLAVHARLAHTTCDQLGVLCAEVNDEDRLLGRFGLSGQRLFSVGIAWVKDECSARECSSASSRRAR